MITPPTPLSQMWQNTINDVIDFDSIVDVDQYPGYIAMTYYLSLPTSEYQNKPLFMAWLQVLLTPFNDAATLAANMYFYFDIDNAVGPQLDFIGQLIGQSRTVNFSPTNGSSPTLSDSDYQVLLKATIIKNTWDGTIPSLYTAWSLLFPDGIIVLQDNQNMTMNVIIAGIFSSNIHDLITNGYIVPRPAGVLVNYVFGTLPAFGFDVEDAYVAGCDVGSWVVLT
jgi:hypothetical protein